MNLQHYTKRKCGCVFSDIDECTTAVHNCNAKAACGNTEGTFTCTCNDGYTGDGVNCQGKNPQSLFVCFFFLFKGDILLNLQTYSNHKFNF